MRKSKKNRISHSRVPTDYDYIITGGGCAGLSLLMRMLLEPSLNRKRILVIDQSPKKENDRTWCFWEKGKGLFEHIVHHQWQQVNFFSDHFSALLKFSPYSYKMIRGIDFYEYVSGEAKQFHNVSFRHGKVNSISNEKDKAIVDLAGEKISAAYIFNSILFGGFPAPATTGRGAKYFLLQHFKGWLIETPRPCFDPAVATFMDFRISQRHGTTFMYMLPVSTTTALVEYTLFTQELLEKDEYETALKEYISTKLNIKEYKIKHEEFGIIPMTNYSFPAHEERIVHIGIAGGQAKASSGYTFQFIQKRSQQVIDSLVSHRPFTLKPVSKRKFHLYDSVLLNVLQHKKMDGDKIFANIFQKNPTQRVLRFLDNETNMFEDLQIMRSVPSSVFFPVALKEYFVASVVSH